MKKKLFIIVLLGLFLLGVTGCGNKLSEEDLIGTSWEYIDESIPEYYNYYGWRYDFYEANIVKKTSLRYDNSDGYNSNFTYKIEDDYIVVYEEDGSLINKYKLNEDKTSLMSIADDEVYKKVES